MPATLGLTIHQVNLVKESWRWISFDRPLQDTANRFFLDFYFKHNPDCLAMFGMMTVNDHKSFTIHALTVIHSIKYAVETLGNPEQCQRLFRTVGLTHLKFGLTDSHVASFLEQWLSYIKSLDAKLFDEPTVAAWKIAGQLIVEQILLGMHSSPGSLLKPAADTELRTRLDTLVSPDEH